MITLKHGMLDAKDVNAEVTFGTDAEPVPGHTERDPDGNIEVTYDREHDPENMEPVLIVMHAENSGKYEGFVVEKDGHFIFSK